MELLCSVWWADASCNLPWSDGNNAKVRLPQWGCCCVPLADIHLLHSASAAADIISHLSKKYIVAWHFPPFFTHSQSDHIIHWFRMDELVRFQHACCGDRAAFEICLFYFMHAASSSMTFAWTSVLCHESWPNSYLIPSLDGPRCHSVMIGKFVCLLLYVLCCVCGIYFVVACWMDGL